MSETLFPGDTEKELPPLRIHHFLAWMATAAFLLSVDRLSGDTQFYGGNANVGFSALGSVWKSLTICCLGFGYYWYRQGKEFLKQPGHGLLVTNGVFHVYETISACILILWLVAAGPAGDTAAEEFGVFSILGGLGYLIATGLVLYLNVRFASRYSMYPRWRRFYILSIIVMVLQIILPMLLGVFAFLVRSSVFGYMFVLIMLPYFLLGMYLLWIVILDTREGYLFHWSHYAGVVVVLGSTLAGVIGTAWMVFFMNDFLLAKY